MCAGTTQPALNPFPILVATQVFLEGPLADFWQSTRA